MARTFYSGGPIFDGQRLHPNAMLEVRDGRVVRLHGARVAVTSIDLAGDILAPGFVDLQVNGGGGVFIGDGEDTMDSVTTAHRGLGTTSLMPTLITNTLEVTRAVLEQAQTAPPGVIGVHLEGPHLDPRKAGAHDPALMRPMTEADLALYCAAAQTMRLKITLAPEAVTQAQVSALIAAGVQVFLGHSACNYATARAYLSLGVRGVTHLWNAMSPLSARAPGLVGAALDAGVTLGLIADGLHVHPSTMRSSLDAAHGPVFLVSDAMACAGTELDEVVLGGRRIWRRDGALRLECGTLAGADLDLRQAVHVVVDQVGVPLERALAMATSVPADVVGAPVGRLVPGAMANMVRLSPDLSRLESVITP